MRDTPQTDSRFDKPDREGPPPKSNKVWVVYGRAEPLREDFFNFLRQIGLEPVEFSEAVVSTGKGSPYIGEVLDAAFRDAQGVIVLLTGDDEAKLKEKYIKPEDPDYERVLTPQPRPNVLFEAGMAFGLYPDRTILVQVGPIRPISDISGRHLLRLDNSPERRNDLVERLKSIGYEVNTKRKFGK